MRHRALIDVIHVIVVSLSRATILTSSLAALPSFNVKHDRRLLGGKRIDDLASLAHGARSLSHARLTLMRLQDSILHVEPG